RQSVAPEEVAIVAAAQEARLLALGPARHGQAGALGLGAGLLLRLLSEREPDPPEGTRIEPREHVRLVLLRVDRASEERAAPVLNDARVMTCRQPRGACPAGERQQLCEPEAPVAARAWVRRLAASVRVDERLHDRGAERLASIERHVWKAEPVAG